MGETTAFMRCQATLDRKYHITEITLMLTGMMVVLVVSSLVAPGSLRYLPSLEILSQRRPVNVPVHPLLLLWTAWVLSGPLCSREVSASLWALGQTLPPGPGSLATGHTADQRLRGTFGGRAL